MDILLGIVLFGLLLRVIFYKRKSRKKRKLLPATDLTQSFISHIGE